MNPTLTFLNQIKDNLEYADYNLIYQSIADLRDKFVPTAILNKGWFIDRVRPNKTGEVFTNVNEISYIHDKAILDSHVTFGRANEPKQAVFYGSIVSHQIKHPRLVAYTETSQVFKNLKNYEDTEEIFTCSRWRILEDIEILEMIFSDEAIKVNEYNRLSLENQMGNYKHLPLADHYEEQGRFFSNEFARDDIASNESFKYKISAAYSNYIWRNTHLKGITYPSVSSKYLGQNVALLPELVDKYLRLEMVGMFRFKKEKNGDPTIYNYKIAQDLGENQMKFNWIPVIEGSI
jgi:hypothetical protein